MQTRIRGGHLTASSSVQPHATSVQRRIPVLGGRRLALGCRELGENHDGVEQASILVLSPMPPLQLRRAAYIPALRSTAGHGVKESGCLGCKRSRKGARGAGYSKRGFGRASAVAILAGCLLFKNPPLRLFGALFLTGAGKVCIKAQGLP